MRKRTASIRKAPTPRSFTSSLYLLDKVTDRASRLGIDHMYQVQPTKGKDRSSLKYQSITVNRVASNEQNPVFENGDPKIDGTSKVKSRVDLMKTTVFGK